MVFKTVWQWISSQNSSNSMNKNIAIRHYQENLLAPMKSLTYTEMMKLADEICKQILNLNIHEQLIVLDREETYLTIPLLLGILQSRNAFFICNSNWPENMLRNVLLQLNPSLFIYQRQNENSIYQQIFHHATLSNRIFLDETINFVQNFNTISYPDIAYVVASSGSTGIPKLIYVSHQCILPNLIQLRSVFDVTKDDCLFRSTPLTFDPSFIDIFLAVHSGACLCTFSADIRRNPKMISSVFDQSQCTIAQMTPSFFRQIAPHCNILQLKTLVLGGEPFSFRENSIIHQMVQLNKRVINIYGLTEMSCWASYHLLNRTDLQRDQIPLGKPLDETALLLQPYLDDPTRTDCYQIVLESQTRWTRIGTERKFRFETDDLIRYDSSSDEMFYLGRRTLTVKRLGVMISLESIEQVAHQSNLLDQCACFMLNENFLVLLCKFKTEERVDQLERFLKSCLTEHFQPNRIVVIEHDLPLNTNGKIDREKLQSVYENTVEKTKNSTVEEIWQNLLRKLPENNASFISDGGNSLLALTFIEQIKQVYSTIDSAYLFDLVLHKTFEDVAKYIANPQEEKKTEYFSSSLPINAIPQSNLNQIWSIQRCSKVFLHDNHHPMQFYSSCFEQSSISTQSLILSWKCSMMKCIDASPLIVLLDNQREYVIIGSHAGLINAYLISNGELQWSFQANDRIEASATLSRNGLFVLIGDYSGLLYVIHCSNGELYSTYQCEGLIKTIPCIHSLLDLVYVGAHDQYLHAIQIQENSSKCMWKFGLKSSCASSPQLSADNTRLYVATLAGDVFAFQSNDGTMLWKRSLTKPIFSTIAIWKERFLLVGCVDQKLYCLTCETGEQKWTFETNGPIFSSPCLFGDKLFIGCHDEFLYAVNLSNEQQGVLEWKCRFPSMIYASPFVFDHGRMLIVGSTNGCLRALSSQTGEILCEIYIPGEGLFSSPICYRDHVIDLLPKKTKFVFGATNKQHADKHSFQYKPKQLEATLPSPEKQMYREELQFHMRSYSLLGKENPKLCDAPLRSKRQSSSLNVPRRQIRLRSSLKLSRDERDHLIGNTADIFASMVKSRRSLIFHFSQRSDIVDTKTVSKQSKNSSNKFFLIKSHFPLLIKDTQLSTDKQRSSM
ncbi:unnamed protein product [Adineta ricciae]|uniref:Uncharacterized protein n=1 Tax=Adineta ricciae TaxID=249248 RepID=A0A815LA50_ADIRI|nr:unnamed protein product [Adineta ricciae]